MYVQPELWKFCFSSLSRLSQTFGKELCEYLHLALLALAPNHMQCADEAAEHDEQQKIKENIFAKQSFEKCINSKKIYELNSAH